MNAAQTLRERSEAEPPRAERPERPPPPPDPLSREEFHRRCAGELEGWAPEYAIPGLAEHAWRVRTRNRTPKSC